jgi:ADP-ribose pyrophosphatase YjhB (NUDIX family)
MASVSRSQFFQLPFISSFIPTESFAGSHRQVGVGGFVLNEKREVLVVQEMNGPLRGQGVWKMPTGLVSVGEDLHLAAVREVKEETVRLSAHPCFKL